MKTWMMSLAMWGAAQAQAGVTIPDFENYELTDVGSMGAAQELLNGMKQDFGGNSICANRAHVWAFDMNRFRNINSGKMYVFFTPYGQADEDITWAYHVAPYVIVGGEEYVLDAAFFHTPVRAADWGRRFGHDTCTNLDPMNKPSHYALMDHAAPGLDYRRGRVPGAMQFDPSEGHCYLRRAPMMYWTPAQVYGHDKRMKTGDAGFDIFVRKSFNETDLVQAHKQAFPGGKRAARKYLGFQDE